jgi:sugar phosphate isomerase/epimerase
MDQLNTKYKRRDFIRMSGNVVAAIAMTPFANRFFLTNDAAANNSYGLQLYTLRTDMPKDPLTVLKQVSSFGYKQIEGYEGSKGMFWGLSNLDFKKYMDDLGMSFVSSHCNISQGFEKKAEDAAAIGMKYLICPSQTPPKTADDYKKVAADFNLKGEICKKNGIRFAYHNHDFEFNSVDGELPLDLMLNYTDPALVDFEMDIYWVVTAKYDPIALFKKYPNRFRLCHLKDRAKNSTEREAGCTLGTGGIDYPRIILEAKTAGMHYFIVEQEKYENTTPIQCVEDNSKYMSKLLL